MIVALCSKGTNLKDELDQRFGRCENFLIYNSDDGEVRSVSNAAKNAAGGAGTMAVQTILDQGAGVIIAPELGPQAMDAVRKFDLAAFAQGDCMNAEEALDAWKNHRLSEIIKAEAVGLHRA